MVANNDFHNFPLTNGYTLIHDDGAIVSKIIFMELQI